jgi:hypothetical protein
MKREIIALLIVLSCGVSYGSQFKDATFKWLTESGAVTTDGKAGILNKVIVSGDTAGDQCIIKDGTATKFTILVPTANDSITWEAPDGSNVIFHTDIDCTLSKSGNMYVTFLYREING